VGQSAPGLTFGKGNPNPVWSPDATGVAFRSRRLARTTYCAGAVGRGPARPRRTAASELFQFPSLVAGMGRTLVFNQYGLELAGMVGFGTSSSKGPPDAAGTRVLRPAPGYQMGGRKSRQTGQWLAYPVGTESGQFESTRDEFPGGLGTGGVLSGGGHRCGLGAEAPVSSYTGRAPKR